MRNGFVLVVEDRDLIQPDLDSFGSTEWAEGTLFSSMEGGLEDGDMEFGRIAFELVQEADGKTLYVLDEYGVRLPEGITVRADMVIRSGSLWLLAQALWNLYSEGD